MAYYYQQLNFFAEEEDIYNVDKQKDLYPLAKELSSIYSEAISVYDRFDRDEVGDNFIPTAPALAELYGLKNEREVYKILDLAVTNCLVPEKIVSKMEQRAVANQQNNCSTAGRSSRSKYDRLRDERKEYLRKLIEVFANSPDNIKNFSEHHGRNANEMGHIIQNVICHSTEYQIDFDTFKKLQSKLLLEAKSPEGCKKICNLFINYVW